MPDATAEIVICGAGIAGVAAAYHLAVKQGMRNVVLVEPGAPLALTSDKSTEAYRNSEGQVVRIISMVGMPACANVLSSPYFFSSLIEMDVRVAEPDGNSSHGVETWVSPLPGLTWGDVDEPSDLVLSCVAPP